jgi:hypothetical protein
MKRSDTMLLKVFLYGLPAVGILILYAYLNSLGVVNRASAFLSFLNGFAGLSFAAWMMLAVYLCIRLMSSEPFREQVIAKLTFMRERDEREVILTGKATRTTFMTSLAILIFLFCLSCLQVSIYRVPPEGAVNGKTGFVSLGLGFDLLEQTKQDRQKDPVQKKNIFFYAGLPLSSTALILLLIAWQIISYNYSIRRLTKA